jgi:hypothetical protein
MLAAKEEEAAGTAGKAQGCHPEPNAARPFEASQKASFPVPGGSCFEFRGLGR